MNYATPFWVTKNVTIRTYLVSFVQWTPLDTGHDNRFSLRRKGVKVFEGCSNVFKMFSYVSIDANDVSIDNSSIGTRVGSQHLVEQLCIVRATAEAVLLVKLTNAIQCWAHTGCQ